MMTSRSLTSDGPFGSGARRSGADDAGSRPRWRLAAALALAMMLAVLILGRGAALLLPPGGRGRSGEIAAAVEVGRETGRDSRAAASAGDERPAQVLSYRHEILEPEAYEELARSWEAFARAHPGDAAALVEWGDALRYSGRREEAEARYREAFALDSLDVAATVAVAHLDAHHQDERIWRLAQARLLRAMHDDPGCAETYYVLWLTALRSGDLELERTCLRRMVETGDMPAALFDYGANMVAGAPEGAIIFTNGDNDTYPPLAYQVLTGRRPDVAIVNLSLLNTTWYIRRLKERGLPIGLADAEIAKLEHRSGHSISAQMQRHIHAQLEREGWPRPLLYSVTVAGENKILAGERILEGILERIVPGGEPADTHGADRPEGEAQLDVERTRELFDAVYRIDSMTDPTVPWEHEGSVASLGWNYVHVLERLGRVLFARTPREDGGIYLYEALEILAFHGRKEAAKEVLGAWEKNDPGAPLLSRARRLLEGS